MRSFSSLVVLSVFAVSCSEENSTVQPQPADSATTTETSAIDTGTGADTTVSDDTSTVDDTGSAGDTGGDAGAVSVTLKAVQDPSDPAHPAANARVTLSDTDLVALTPRLLIGSSTAMECRFAVWIGKPLGGDFAGVQVQELITRGAATNCFGVTPGKIPAVVNVGDKITAVQGNYGEFCAGPTGTPMGMCRDFEQSQIFLGGASAKLTLGAAGGAPVPTAVTVADLVKDAAGAPGPKALALEGTLVRVSGVKILQEMSGSFTATLVVDAADTASSKKLEIQISNFMATACVREHFAAKNGMIAGSITGILTPDFGRWKIRLRDQNDVLGLMCAAGDAGTDAATDGG